MITRFDIIKSLVRTEKGTSYLEPYGKYLFWVAKYANKLQIKKAVEQIYKVKVKKINTQICPGKLKKVRYQYGKTPDWKRATVTLVEGQKIETT
ncbi:MAG: 50S ribosomal protein L23 [Candidatus Omnitrophica bacterium]|nr:50S ribosomal protein L23 [Candidatus Omnitrophota bacterium]